MDLAEHLAEYKEQGFTVFPALHSAEWVAEVSCDAPPRCAATMRMPFAVIDCNWIAAKH